MTTSFITEIPNLPPPLADRVRSLTARAGGGWEVHIDAKHRLARGEDVIVLSVGDHDHPTPAPIVDAAASALREGPHKYTPYGGIAALRTAIARSESTAFGTTVSPDQVVVTSGAQGALYSVLQCIAGPGDEVIAADPMYVSYPETIAAAGASMVTVPCRPESGFSLDPEAVAAAVTSATRAILVTTPSNPTGAVIHQDVMTALAEIARAHNLWLISDEVYRALTFEAACPTFGALTDHADRTVVLGSLSKSFAMTGWRVGWAVGPAPLVEGLVACANVVHYGLPGFAQLGGVAALEAGEELIAPIRRRLKDRCDHLCGGLAAVDRLRPIVPEGGMFVMVDIRDTGLTAPVFARRLLDEAGVSVMPGESFGASAAGFVRMSLCAESSVLDEAVRRIAVFVETL